MRLNAGCADGYLPGWVNLDADPRWADPDLNPGPKPDVIGDVRALPFPARSVQQVMASHLLEHLPFPGGVVAALTEIGRVLVPPGDGNTGRLLVVCPDIERAVLDGEPRRLLEQIVAWPEEWNPPGRYPAKTPPAGHAWTAAAALVELALDWAGLVVDRECSGRLPVLAAAGWPVPDLGNWQCAFIAYSPMR